MAEESSSKSIVEQYQDIITRHKIKLESPPHEKIEESHKFIIIRHGFSEHNFCQYETYYQNPVKSKTDPRYVDLQINPIHTDNSLHPIGIQQCLNSQKHINEIDFEVVFISPLQRTIQTCLYMFATHPNRQNIKFILLPELFECLCSSGCFGPSTLTSLRQKMEQLAKSFDIHLDFSKVEELGRYWQIKVLEDQNISKAILEELETSDKSDELAYQNIVYSHLAKASSFFLETWKMLFMRSRRAINILQQSQKNYSSDPKKKIGVISHGFFIKCLTASKMEENGRLEEGIIMDNCGKLPYNF